MKQNKTNIPTVKVSNVSKKFDSLVAVDDVSFEITNGEIIALLGPNGAGKSTLMNMIAGYLTTTSGKIYINGADVEKNDIVTKKNIGFLPEGAPMYADMSVKLFLKYFIELKLNLEPNDELSRKQITDIYAAELDRVIKTAKIENVTEQKIENLSKGYARRVGFAASIIGNPPILLLDEPTDGLDPNQKAHMRKLIKDMSKDKTIIISTHLLDEAETIATSVILINKGKIIANGSVDELLKKAKKKTLEEAFKALTSKGDDNE